MIKDKFTGESHIVGTDTHDMLYVDDENGGLQYLNLQNGEGTGAESDYEFVRTEDAINGDIQFIALEDLLKEAINHAKENGTDSAAGFKAKLLALLQTL
jgi:hypothetical protein